MIEVFLSLICLFARLDLTTPVNLLLLRGIVIGRILQRAVLTGGNWCETSLPILKIWTEFVRAFDLLDVTLGHHFLQAIRKHVIEPRRTGGQVKLHVILDGNRRELVEPSECINDSCPVGISVSRIGTRIGGNRRGSFLWRRILGSLCRSFRHRGRRLRRIAILQRHIPSRRNIPLVLFLLILAELPPVHHVLRLGFPRWELGEHGKHGCESAAGVDVGKVLLDALIGGEVALGGSRGFGWSGLCVRDGIGFWRGRVHRG
mmetsp:Transcript_23001/g.48506  ORF Transcript_23001/g.48506 Transcript_23001/m.48506 type:complete len:260 (-) Transcript_23001:116-895(-)